MEITGICDNLTAFWISGSLAAFLVAFGPIAGIFRLIPPALGTLSGVMGGLLALFAILLYPQVWPGLWSSLLAVSCYLVSLRLNRRWFRLFASVVWPVLLWLLVLRIWMSLSAPSADQSQVTDTTLRIVHVLLWVAATASVWLVAIQALLLLRRHRRIKHGLTRPEENLPALDEMTRILTGLAAAGLVLLTIAMLYSHWWLQFEAVEPRHLLNYGLAGAVWLMLAGLLLSYRFFGLRGYRLVGWTFGLSGTLVLVLAWGISFG